MCIEIDVYPERKIITSPRGLAEWLGVDLAALSLCDGYEDGLRNVPGWENSCLCPIDVRAALDANGVWSVYDPLLGYDAMRRN